MCVSVCVCVREREREREMAPKYFEDFRWVVSQARRSSRLGGRKPHQEQVELSYGANMRKKE